MAYGETPSITTKVKDHIMADALKVTESTLPFIMEYGAAAKFDLSHVKYALEEANELGFDELYIITDGTVERRNITFTTMVGPDFFRSWKFTGDIPMFPTAFSPIERV